VNLDHPLHLDSPCRKQTVVAFLTTSDGKRLYIGSNWCKTPVRPGECPRADMPSGSGYWMCKDICRQPAHAEVDALKKAGKDGIGGMMYIVGHTRVCDDCSKKMKKAQVKWSLLK